MLKLLFPSLYKDYLLWDYLKRYDLERIDFPSINALRDLDTLLSRIGECEINLMQHYDSPLQVTYGSVGGLVTELELITERLSNIGKIGDVCSNKVNTVGSKWLTSANGETLDVLFTRLQNGLANLIKVIDAQSSDFSIATNNRILYRITQDFMTWVKLVKLSRK